jgi:four helix bundle protein
MTKSQIPMTNKCPNPNVNKKYDLEERTALFGENIIAFVKTIPQPVINKSLISQIVRSGTSVGANYMEADAAESKKILNIK